MRLINVNAIREGDIIARDIISYEGGILLTRSSKFKNAFRQKLLERNIYEVYIDDELSQGISPQDIINPQIRRQINQDIKTEFEKIKHTLDINVEGISRITTTLFEELSKKEIVCDVMDLKMNDDYTYQHCIGVAILTTIVCNKMGIRKDHAHKIVMGALMHDIGKIIIPKNTLNKPEKLTQEEYELLKTHVEIGYRIVEKNSSVSPITKLAVLCHHEREDGSGYPLGKGDELHIGAKIVGVCDVFHALMSNRPYRQALSVKEVIAIAQMEKINVPIRQVVESILAFYPVGSTVLLSNGDIGIVEKNFVQDVARPLVKVVYNVNTHQKHEYKLNLQERLDVCVAEKIPDIPHS
ncbi:HD-GYP domain-containing protein [Cellulosilyticum sp. I15G10I2]|uniref:HD-GYP domain-containing protein n=1 Tax=Cellulosilyticum sp. I15G10I2 TaxID=1892843 RepID=UPI00085C7443|nr:HD domain-containing phosphohydrolase [Cellulosilyticum sp. I15G10I2]